jgi:hypothetical protein
LEYVFSNKLKLLDIIPNPGLRELHHELCQEAGEDISLQQLTNIYAENIYAWKENKWVSLDEMALNIDY